MENFGDMTRIFLSFVCFVMNIWTYINFPLAVNRAVAYADLMFECVYFRGIRLIFYAQYINYFINITSL